MVVKKMIIQWYVKILVSSNHVQDSKEGINGTFVQSLHAFDIVIEAKHVLFVPDNWGGENNQWVYCISFSNQEGNKNKYYVHLLSVYLESFGGKWQIDTCINSEEIRPLREFLTQCFHSRNKIVLMLELEQIVIQDPRHETLVWTDSEVC